MLVAVLLYIVAGVCITGAVNYAFGNRDSAIEWFVDVLLWPVMLFYLIKNFFNA